MSTPRNHHYVPQWLLRAWCSSDDSLLQSFFRLPTSKLSSQRKSPRKVAVERDLYSWMSPNHSDPTEPEKTFFQELDSNAAKAAEILREPGTQPMAKEVRRHWARFLAASVIRTPFAIEGWRKQFRQIGEEKLGDDIQTVDALLPEWFNDTGLEQVIDFLSGDKAVEMWMDMQWFVERTDGAEYELLTSDWPWVGHYVGDSQRRMLLFPIAPRRLFCATDDPLIANMLTTGPRDFGVNWSNNLQIKHAQRHLFATDDSLKWHIEKFFGDGFPDPPLPENSNDR